MAGSPMPRRVALAELRNFAVSLRRDYAAVRAALPCHGQPAVRGHMEPIKTNQAADVRASEVRPVAAARTRCTH